MSRWQRAAISFGSVLVSAFIVCVVCIVANYDQFVDSLRSVGRFVVGAILIVAIGWLATLPLALLIDKLTGPRLWIVLFAGISIGPGLLSAMDLYAQLTGPTPHVHQRESFFVWTVVTTISSLATLTYILSLRPYPRRRIQPTT